MIADLRCPECLSYEVEIMTPPLVYSRDTEGAEYVIDPPASWLCMACRSNGHDAAGDLVIQEVAA